MNWPEKLNDAIAYLEQHLDGKPDYREAAKACCCSLSKFQSLFMYVTDMTASEYVRQRRMTLAAAELLTGDMKIIDLALKYGYDSPEAFTRAFQAFHGYPPSVTRRFGVYKRRERLSIQVHLYGGDVRVSTEMIKNIIENVRPIGWGLTSANPYVGAITACMDALGLGNDFRLAGMVSGVGFSFTWYPGAPNDANMVDDAMIRRTFEALGYRVSIYRDGDTHGSPSSREKGFYMSQIVSAIDRGFPCLGFGFTNDYPFACAILGYENGGERLYLRSYWDEDVESAGHDYQTTTQWYRRCRGLVVIEEKIAPALTGKELMRHCLSAASELANRRTIRFYDLVLPYGLATYDTMIAVLEDHAYWEGREDAFYAEMDRSYSCVGMLLADHYLNWIAKYWLKENADAGEAGELIRAGCEYIDMLNWLTMAMIGERRTFLENPQDMRNREAREAMVPFIRLVKHLDKSAVDCFQRALEQIV